MEVQLMRDPLFDKMNITQNAFQNPLTPTIMLEGDEDIIKKKELEKKLMKDYMDISSLMSDEEESVRKGKF